jgi:hypothetical protein
MKKVLLAIMLFASQPSVAGASHRNSEFCETVRAKVSQYGKLRSLAWAISQGYTVDQINKARKCLL